MCYFTKHAVERVTGRLASLTNYGEVAGAVDRNTGRMCTGRNFVLVRDLHRRVEIQDPDVVPDGIARGDWLVAVVDNYGEPKVITVVLRKSTSQSPNYQNILR